MVAFVDKLLAVYSVEVCLCSENGLPKTQGNWVVSQEPYEWGVLPRVAFLGS